MKSRRVVMISPLRSKILFFSRFDPHLGRPMMKRLTELHRRWCKNRLHVNYNFTTAVALPLISPFENDPNICYALRRNNRRFLPLLASFAFSIENLWQPSAASGSIFAQKLHKYFLVGGPLVTCKREKNLKRSVQVAWSVGKLFQQGMLTWAADSPTCA